MTSMNVDNGSYVVSPRQNNDVVICVIC